MEREDIENSLKVLSHIVDDDFIITVDEARKIIRIDEETIEVLQAKIERLQAKLPKQGEWVKNEDRCGWHCSCCKVDNHYAYIWNCETGEYELQDNYCPNCGSRNEAKMEVQDGE